MKKITLGLLVPFSLMITSTAEAADVSVPVLVPVTGFLALEGASQRDGALVALENPPPGVTPKWEVVDTGTSPEAAVTAFERAQGDEPGAVVASMLGVQMLALMEPAAEYRIPLITVSGTAEITEKGNPEVFRFFPGDATTKRAHARYVVEELGGKRPAVIYQTTAYGQSGQKQLRNEFAKLGVEPVFEEGVAADAKDYLPTIVKALAAKPDVLVLHLHAGPTALFLRQAAANGVNLPIVSGSAVHQPSTAALLEPAELKGVCAETASSPASGGDPETGAFARSFKARFGREPDAYALGQYDGTRMVLDAVAKGAGTAEEIRNALATTTYKGLAMTYKSDGKGNMAHSAMIVCYDGTSRVPKIVKRYDDEAR